MNNDWIFDIGKNNMNNNWIFDICGEDGFYYLITKISRTDNGNSTILKIDIKEYRTILSENYNAYHTYHTYQTHNGNEDRTKITETYFKNKEDALNAANWANSLMLMNKLRGI